MTAVRVRVRAGQVDQRILPDSAVAPQPFGETLDDPCVVTDRLKRHALIMDGRKRGLNAGRDQVAKLCDPHQVDQPDDPVSAQVGMLGGVLTGQVGVPVGQVIGQGLPGLMIAVGSALGSITPRRLSSASDSSLRAIASVAVLSEQPLT